MAMGDIAVGEKVFKKCAACHSIIKGGKKQHWSCTLECSWEKKLALLQITNILRP